LGGAKAFCLGRCQTVQLPALGGAADLGEISNWGAGLEIVGRFLGSENRWAQ